jgi:SAM-dependent methyltransferase
MWRRWRADRNAPPEGAWTALAEQPGWQRRQYSSYDEYVAHQKQKLELLDAQTMALYDRHYRRILRQRLESLGVAWRGKKVLCLAARLGTEVKAFRDLGAECIGIDLNPGRANSLVLAADFHFLPFGSATMDVAFTNSLDHALDVERMAGEAARVLKSDGLFVVEAVAGSGEGIRPDRWASVWWEKTDDVIARLAKAGFRATQRSNFDKPWRGATLVFGKNAAPQ